MYRTVLSAAVAVAMSASLTLAQNARIISLGTPTMLGVNTIEDVSDVLYFPSDAAVSKDMVQGAWNNHVFVTKELMDMFTVGFAFGMPSYVTTTLGGGTSFHNLLGTAMTTANGTLTGSGSAAAVPGEGSFDIAMPTAPSNAGHLLVGMDLGGISVGADLFREASNTKEEGQELSLIGTNTRTIEGNGFTKYGAMGAILGAGLEMGDMQLKGAAGLVLRSFNGEMVHDGDEITSTGTLVTDFNEETSTMKTTSGIHLPIYARVGMPLGPQHTLTGMVNYTLNSAEFEAEFDDGDATTASLDPVKSSKVSNNYVGLAVSDDMEIGQNTHLISTLLISMATSTTTPEEVDFQNPQVSNSNITFPSMTLGIEHSIPKWWKFDEVILRAGGRKSVTWTSMKQEGDDELVETSNAQTVSAFNWTTGLSLIKGDFELAMCVAPANWNSVYFIGGAGPTGTTVTMTYNFGGNGTSSSGNSYDTYETPSYEAPATEETTTDDPFGF